MATGTFAPMTLDVSSSAAKRVSGTGLNNRMTAQKNFSGSHKISGRKKGFQKVLKKSLEGDGKTPGETREGNSKTEESKAGESQSGKAYPVVPESLFRLFQFLLQKGVMSRDEVKQWISEKVIPALEEGKDSIDQLMTLMDKLAKADEGLKDVSVPFNKAGKEELSDAIENWIIKKIHDESQKKGQKIQSGEQEERVGKKPSRDVILKMKVAFDETGDNLRSRQDGIIARGEQGKYGAGQGRSEGARLREGGAFLDEVMSKSGRGRERIQADSPSALLKEAPPYSHLIEFTKDSHSVPTNFLKGSEEGLGNIDSSRVMEQIVQGVNFFREDGQYTMRVALNPPELGHVDVSLTVKGHQVQALFMVENAATHSALSHKLPELQALLANQGLTVRDIAVHVGGGNSQGFQGFSGGMGQGHFTNGMNGNVESFERENSQGSGASMIVEDVAQKPRDLYWGSMDRINIFA